MAKIAHARLKGALPWLGGRDDYLVAMPPGYFYQIFAYFIDDTASGQLARNKGRLRSLLEARGVRQRDVRDSLLHAA